MRSAHRARRAAGVSEDSLRGKLVFLLPLEGEMDSARSEEQRASMPGLLRLLLQTRSPPISTVLSLYLLLQLVPLSFSSHPNLWNKWS